MFPLSMMLKSFVRVGSLTVFDAAGGRHVFGTPGGGVAPDVTMRLTDPKLYRALFFNPELHVGEAYMDGRMSFQGCTLRDFLTLFSMNRRAFSAFPMQRVVQRISLAFRRFQQANPIGKAEKHVAHHYDIGNALFGLFLDPGMFYTCAYFREGDESLEEAQRAKCRLVAAKLRLRPGMKVLDIGSGFGGLAMYLAKVADVEVTGVTLSREQHALAEQRAREAGLQDRVRFVLQDYRHTTGKFDRIVSVGMFEQVGPAHYDEFFAKVKDLLTEDGVMLLHSIGKMSPPGTVSPWLRKYIFPGGYSPALSEVFPALENLRLWVTDVEFLRLHYATTLAHWHRRFEANRAAIAELYDESFCRMWEFYLISAEMSFRTGSQEIFQMQFAKTRDTTPLTRDYMFEEQQALMRREKEVLAPTA